MENNVNYSEMVERAQIGDSDRMNCLVELARERLFAYIYRLTLNYDLTQDLLQETLLEVVKSLVHLRDPERFWPWVFRTALGKVQHHFRRQEHKRMVQISAIEKERLLKRASQPNGNELGNLIQKELSQAVIEAMNQLKLNQRNILALRCFEQMPYSEIADLMDCSELAARAMFFRAKHALKLRLSRNGFSKGMLLVGLSLFGLMTGSAKATTTAGTVTAGLLEVGPLAAIVGAASTKAGLTIITAVSAAMVGLTVRSVVGLICVLFYILLCFALVSLTGIYTE